MSKDMTYELPNGQKRVQYPSFNIACVDIYFQATIVLVYKNENHMGRLNYYKNQLHTYHIMIK